MKIWMVFERLDYSIASKIWSVVFFLFVVLSVLTFGFESVHEFRSYTSEFKASLAYFNFTVQMVEGLLDPVTRSAVTIPDDWVHYLRHTSFAFFIVDFFIRFLACPAKTRFFRQTRNWLEIFIAVESCIFFIMELKVIPHLIAEGNITTMQKNFLSLLFALSGARALRILYIAKHFDSMKILLLCAKSSMKELLMLVTVVVSFVTVFGTMAYTAEALDNVDTFSSIPQAMWWAIVTMTTVGYGDLYPISLVGKLVGTLCALSGVIVMAMPIAVIASKFSAYHDNLSPLPQRKARASFLKENPEFGLDKELDGHEDQGHCASEYHIGEGNMSKRNA